MKTILIIIITSLIVVIAGLILNFASYNGSTKKDQKQNSATDQNHQ